MKQVVATVIAKGKPIPGLERPHGRSISFSQTIKLRCPEIAREARPGQFVMVDCGPDCVLPRPFSVHQVIDKEDLALYFAVLEDGKGTRWLSQREIGDRVKLFGPLGNGFSINPDAQRLLLVAGGIGIAPLYFLAQETLSNGYEVTLLQGAQTSSQLYPERLLPSGVKLVTITDDGTTDNKGRVNELISGHINDKDQVFACGPLGMYQDMVTKYSRLLKDRPVQISLEVVMGCGRGVCYGCTVKTKKGLKKVCQDGPVFDLDDILWDELTRKKGGKNDL